LVCPHATIRPKLIDPKDLENAPASFNTVEAKGAPGYQFKIQVYTEDCQGCAVCVHECPTQALEMSLASTERERGEGENNKFFSSLPQDNLGTFKLNTVKGSQFKTPLLEFSGACAGCGETAYVKLITQLFGDRMLIANATGCSSIWGGTFPTIPYAKNKDGRGPAWANSLFEDNAEYGYGMRLATNSNRKQLKYNVEKLIKSGYNGDLLAPFQYALEHWMDTDEAARANSDQIKALLPKAIETATSENNAALTKISELSSHFMEKSIWAFGGDGWAYDIGYGGLDHVLAQNRNINILVLDTELYSNTGGQASKSTPLGSVAKFAEAGKGTVKKDLGLMMMSYGYVYVASISLAANKNQALQVLAEAEAYPGPSIVIAYAPCINHGIDMQNSCMEEKRAVDSGYWLLYRYNPLLKEQGKNPFILESKEPKLSPLEFIEGEVRYSSLHRSFPENVSDFRAHMEKYLQDRYAFYKKMAE
jgi:pyruvate-ferredoxin/flavodoxin oxidoreductase